MRKTSVFVLIAIMLLVSISLPTDASTDMESVRISVPSGPIVMNGHLVDNAQREYPFIEYSTDYMGEMLYFPLTWFDMRHMNTEGHYDENGVFQIKKAPTLSEYVAYQSSSANKSTYTAQLSKAGIEVVWEDGAHSFTYLDGYPVIAFRNVLYLPLTDSVLDALQWTMTADSINGIQLQSNGKQVETVELPEFAADNNYVHWKGHYYYVETAYQTNVIYKQVDDFSEEPQIIYRYDVSVSYGFNDWVNFYEDDGALWFMYHTGGATMGSDHYFRIYEDGTVINHQGGYVEFDQGENGFLVANMGVPPFGANIFFEPNDTSLPARPLGTSDYIYGWYRRHKEDGTSLGSSDTTTLIGDSAYVMTSSWDRNDGIYNNVFRINVNTGYTETIIDESVTNFKIQDEHIYYSKTEDDLLYVCDINGDNERLLINDPENGRGMESWYLFEDGNIILTKRDDDYLQNIWKLKPDGRLEKIEMEPVWGVLESDSRIGFLMEEGKDYGMVVVDSTGEISMKVTDQVEHVFLNEDVLMYNTPEQSVVKIVH